MKVFLEGATGALGRGRIPARQCATEASLHQPLETLRVENQRLREDNASLKAELALAYGQQRQARGG